MRERLPEALLSLCERLNGRGIEAYPVGGSVRDLLSGRVPSDWDVAVSSAPRETERALAGCRFAAAGEKYGTVTVLTDGISVEMTTFRTDGTYSDGRHPDTVRFARRLEEDLARRDYTVCAMALDCRTDTVIDPFGGRRDLRERILRTVGDPDRRFTEDALRILRGLRLASRLDFAVGPETAAAMRRQKERLGRLPAERVRAELEKLLCGEAAGRVLRESVDVVGVLLPELLPMVGFDQRNPHHDRDVFEHTLAVLDAVPPTPVLRWAALFHDCGKPSCFTTDGDGVGHFTGHPAVGASLAAGVLRRLRCGKKLTDDVTALIAVHDIRFPAEKRPVARWAGRWGDRRFLDFLELRRGDGLGRADPSRAESDYRKMRALYEEAGRERAVFSVRDLAVSGRDCLEAGLSGPRIGHALRELAREVRERALPNEKEALRDALRSRADIRGEMKRMKPEELAAMIEHTLLKPEAGPEEIRTLCGEARAHGFAAVCVNPVHVPLAAELLRGTAVRICTVVGFPLGALTAPQKAEEAKRSAALGADELDMVLSLGAAKAGDWNAVRADIAAVRGAVPDKTLKVILETCLLTDAEKKKACEAARAAGADFVKTSTGFSAGGATAEDVALMRAAAGPGMGVKASGGIRDYATALRMVNAGATRIGASAGVAILREAEAAAERPDAGD